MHESSVQLTKAKKAIAFSICSLDFQRRLRKQVMWREPKKSHGVCPPIWKSIQSSEPTEGTGREWPLWGLSEIPTSDLSRSPPGRWVCGARSWDRSARSRVCSRSPCPSPSSCPTSTTSTTGKPTRRRCRVRTSTMSRAVHSCLGP